MKIAGLPKKYAKLGFKKGWRAFKASKRKRGSKSTTKSKTKRGTTSKMSKKPKRAIPVGRIVGTAATGVLMALDAISPNPVVEAAMTGDFVGAAVNFASNVRMNYHPARIFANATPAIITNVAGGILDKMRMNKSVDVMGYKLKGL